MAERHDLTLGESAVLLRLAFRAATGEVWERQDVLAAGSRVSRETVRRALGRFVRLGLVTRHEKRFGGTITYRPVWREYAHQLPTRLAIEAN